MPVFVPVNGSGVEMGFDGWPAEALEFYEGLEADNSKAYWTEHKDSYDRDVLEPMTALLAELEPEFGPGKVFRPYRDLRFSPDKTPYKTAIGAELGDGGYVQLSARGLAAGRGMYMMAKDQIERYRRAVADDIAGGQLNRIIDDAKTRHDLDIQGHNSLKTSPRGYPKDHPRIELLRHKGLIAWRDWPVGAWLGTAEPAGEIVAFLRSAGPLMDWLDAHVGDSELVPDRP